MKKILYIIAALSLVTACTADDDWLKNATEEQKSLLGRAINFDASVADAFTSRATYNGDGSFNEGDVMTIYRQFYNDKGATFDTEHEAYRVYYYKAHRAANTNILLKTEWAIMTGQYGSDGTADDVPADEEYRRVEEGLRIVREVAPQIPVSVDTFRASVAERCVGEWGVEIINDIAAGGLDPDMIATVGRVKAAYIMMHMRGNPHTMMSLCDYDDVVADILQYFCRKINEAQQAGICDIILDPGFGFSKTLDQNYELLSRMDDFLETGLPLLVGVSRKSMIYKLFGTTPEEALNGTTAINTIALMQGASILRVHDVKAAREAVEIFCKTFPNE